MSHKTWTWYSHRVGKEMTVARWGEVGVPVLLFPTAAADCFDYQRFLMLDVLAPLLEAGRIKVYSCETNAGDGWLNPDARPREKSRLQALYDSYVVNELLPHIKRDSGGVTGFVAAGASIGAYNAVNTAAKHPRWFSHVIAMSGTYYFDRWMDGHRDQDYYFNQPILYLGGVPDGPQLQGIRDINWVIATGQGDYEAPEESVKLAGLLRSKGARVNLELWGHDMRHDWVTWRAMLPLFLDKLLP